MCTHVRRSDRHGRGARGRQYPGVERIRERHVHLPGGYAGEHQRHDVVCCVAGLALRAVPVRLGLVLMVVCHQRMAVRSRPVLMFSMLVP